MTRTCINICAALLILVFGCWGNPGGGVPVTGTVTYKGEKLVNGTVTYVNGMGDPVAIGFIGVDGSYSLDQSASFKGIPPGKYRVFINSWKEEPGPTPGGGYSVGVSRIPAKFRSYETSGLNVEVGESGSVIDISLED